MDKLSFALLVMRITGIFYVPWDIVFLPVVIHFAFVGVGMFFIAWKTFVSPERAK